MFNDPMGDLSQAAWDDVMDKYNNGIADGNNYYYNSSSDNPVVDDDAAALERYYTTGGGDRNESIADRLNKKALVIFGVDKATGNDRLMAVIKNSVTTALIYTGLYTKGFFVADLGDMDILSPEHDAFMINVGYMVAAGPGFGSSFSIVHINKGDDQGWFMYGSANDWYAGFDFGGFVLAGGIDFNYGAGQPLDRRTFTGKTFTYSGSLVQAAASYVVSYADGNYHLLGFGPVLYSGILEGFTFGTSETFGGAGSFGVSNSTVLPPGMFSSLRSFMNAGSTIEKQ